MKLLSEVGLVGPGRAAPGAAEGTSPAAPKPAGPAWWLALRKAFRKLPQARRRRVAQALGRAPQGHALQRLATLLAQGRGTTPAALELCIELGLLRRARETLPMLRASDVGESTRIRLTLLAQQPDAAAARARRWAESAPLASTPRPDAAGLSAVIDALAPVAPEVALALIAQHLPTHRAEPALLLQGGYLSAASARLATLGPALGADRWLLEAGLNRGTLTSLTCLNRYLADHGLAPVELRDPGATLAINQLRGTVTGSPPPGSHQLGATPARLSVVMTVYQGADHVGAAMRSVLASTLPGLELIVIDDGSSDASWRCITEVAATDPRVKPHRLAQNVGTYAAKNVGLALAGGEFVAFQDADDWAHPERFARCLAVLDADPRVIAVSAMYVRLSDDGVFHSSRVWPLTRWTPNSVVFRRQPVLARLGAFDEHRFGADSEFMARLRLAFAEPAALVKLGAPLTIAAHRPRSLMTAASTGVDARGLSRVRMDYQEAWSEDLLRRLQTGASLRREPVLGTPALIAAAPLAAAA